ncbi:MAG: GNAT family N-acetyltransferase [Lachnospiraceae bacterium]|nr:GNAT family N-acetyltransferase [Lachnospiraceae bacterium]
MMNGAVIRKVEAEDERIASFLNVAFSDYAVKNDVQLNFDEFLFVAEDSDGKIIGAITGRAYYNEVHVGDLIVDESCRRSGLGSRLIGAVEDAYKGKGYEIITLTTFGFQAPEFYKKLGFQVEFVRENKDPKLSKYFLSKHMLSFG